MHPGVRHGDADPHTDDEGNDVPATVAEVPDGAVVDPWHWEPLAAPEPEPDAAPETPPETPSPVSPAVFPVTNPKDM